MFNFIVKGSELKYIAKAKLKGIYTEETENIQAFISSFLSKAILTTGHM